MRKAVVTALAISALMAGSVGGCQGDFEARNPEEFVGSAVSDIKAQAAEELRKALSNEITAFFRSDDLSKSLGIDSEEQDRLEESVKAYISSYSMDEEKLSEAKESLDTLLKNAEGLSAEEIQDKIEGIFQE